MSDKKDIELRKKIADALIKARKIVADHKSEYHGVYTASGGGGTTTSNSSTTVPQDVLNEYNQVTAQANQVAAQPLQQYSGQIVANQNAPETAAYNTIDNMQGITAPYTQQASGLIGQATQNINPQTVTAAQIQGYESPYTQSVLNTTMAAENNQDAQQQAQLQGNAISSGAWGGDRSAVAQGILGGQQALANNATNAGILNTGYTTAEQEANTQQQAALGAQEASQYLQESGGVAANQLGTSALNNTLTGANAQLTSGQLQQQQQQAELNVPYEEFLQQQAYPFQTTGWLGNIAEGIGSNEGGSSTSSTTQPSEGLFGLKRGGGIVQRRDDGGSITPIAQGITSNANPFQQNVNSNYSQMSVQQLQQLAQRIPPGTPQGQAVQAALRQKQFMPNVARGGGIIPHYDGGGGAATPDGYNPDVYDADLAQAASVQNGSNPAGAALDAISSGASSMPSQNITTNPEGLPAPTPPVNAPDHPANSPGYLQNMPEPHQANPWLSVAAGVLGTLAGRSRNPLVDIGQGGLIGLNNYAEQQKMAQTQNYQEGNFHQNAQKLMDEADLEKQKFAEEKLQDSQNQTNTQKDLNIKQQVANQGKVSANNFGQPYFTTGPNAGQLIPQQSPMGVDGKPMRPPGMPDYQGVQTIGANIGIQPNFLNPKTPRSPDATQAAKMQYEAGNNVPQLENAESNLERIKQLIPTVDQGMMATAARAAQKAYGEPNATPDTANAAAIATLPVGSKERAAYEELAKLEGNAALQNEIQGGVASRYLGFNMVKLGQKLFADPEMTKEAQGNIINKSLLATQTAKGANEIIPQLDGATTATLAQAKQKYWNDSFSNGYAIPSSDYTTGAWKKQGYIPPSTQAHYTTAQPNQTTPSAPTDWSVAPTTGTKYRIIQ